MFYFLVGDVKWNNETVFDISISQTLKYQLYLIVFLETWHFLHSTQVVHIFFQWELCLYISF